MYWRQWSRSAGFASGPVLSMMRTPGSWVSITIRSISSRRGATCPCSCIAASTAVCAWNSAGKEILNSTFSMT